MTDNNYSFTSYRWQNSSLVSDKTTNNIILGMIKTSSDDNSKRLYILESLVSQPTQVYNRFHTSFIKNNDNPPFILYYFDYQSINSQAHNNIMKRNTWRFFGNNRLSSRRLSVFHLC
ncbi:hypothetical protein O6H91_04G018800 [Diphasiastrum complanatum]|uniref:Uncharacterized protein n=1 Tax=Diphasiastrum complanatum TaxID=34168 RepID=A0ACC2DUT8_DIPCM|nr:hypothetical protein O6H91_04G018800 [Diphasiastrum complanatum]